METQFIPGAGPPKLKELGTTGALNLYPPCFSIIFDSRKEGGEALMTTYCFGEKELPISSNKHVYYVSCI